MSMLRHQFSNERWRGGGGGGRGRLGTLNHLPLLFCKNVYLYIWLTSHPRSTVVLLDTGTLGTSRETYSEDADGATRTGNPSVYNRGVASSSLTIDKCVSLWICFRRAKKFKIYSLFHGFWQSFISIEVCRDCLPALASSCKTQLTGTFVCVLFFLKVKHIS